MVDENEEKVPEKTEAPDEIVYQEKNVFFADFLELVRAHGKLAERFLKVEKGGAGGGAGDAGLSGKVDDLVSKVAAGDADQAAIKAKLNKLFPDEDFTNLPPVKTDPENPTTPIEDKPVEDKPAEDKPVEDKPVDPPVDTPPVEEKPVEDKPVDQPVEDQPVGV